MSYAAKDTERRGEVAVLMSLAESGGTTRIVFDDVTRLPMVDGIAWAHRALFTAVEYPTEELNRLALSKEDFARIGENVVIRLLALTGRLQDGA